MSIAKLVAAGLGSIGATFVRPRVDLADDSVAVGLTPGEVLEGMRERFAADEDQVLASEPDRLVRRFSGSEGRFSYETIEVVRFTDDSVTFEHLAGPFAECRETFQMTEIPGGTRFTHSGYFRLRGGLWTLPLARGPVKAAFENHVRGHMQNLASENPLTTGEADLKLVD